MPQLPSFERIGSYALIRSVGKNAYSESYETTNPATGTRCKLTVFLREFVEAAHDFEERFLRHCARAQKTDSKFVARIVDFGVEEEYPFIATDMLDGRTLADDIAGGRKIPPAFACQLITDVGEGLHDVHKAGAIHRDIRPGSILITPFENGRLLNLGRGGLLPEDSFRLAEEIFLGSPLYIAPEVSLGQPHTARSDLYAFACTAYHLLSGQAPFTGNSADEIIRQHTSASPPRLVDVRPELPSALGEILLESMAKEPSSRYLSVDLFLLDWKAAIREIGHELHDLRGSGRVGSTPTSGVPVIEENEPADRYGAEMAPAKLKLRGSNTPSRGVPVYDPGFDQPAERRTGKQQPGFDDLAAIMPGRVAGADTPPRPGGASGFHMISTDTNPEGKDVDIYGRENREMMSRLRPEARPRFSIGYLLFLTLILLALAGGATIFVARGGIDRIRSIWSDEKDFAELEAQMDQLRKWEETHDRISGLPYYILQFERLERRSPTVEELESAGLVSREQIVDGYGRMLVYDNINQEIVSFGPDRSRRTADDFVYSIEKSKFTAEPPKPELDSGELDEYTTFRK